MPEILTQRQKDILNYISSSIHDRGYPPTLREIGEQFGIRSTNGVNDHLRALEKKGYLAREDLKSRAMRPIGTFVGDLSAENGNHSMGLDSTISAAEMLAMDFVEVPIVGRVAAGQPLLAVEHVEDTVKVDRFFVGAHKDVFALRIVGQSMIEDGIFDGDFVFVKKTSAANRGDVVVAMIEGEATVKRYYPEGEVIRFQPANATMDPIYVRKVDFRSVDIIGVVVGVYRKMMS